MKVVNSLEVIKRGFQTTVQDFGRFGYRKFGVPTSGVMDKKSMIDANKLVGNPISNPVIENTLYGGIYRFNDPALLSICGAKCKPKINGKSVPQYESIDVERGDELEVDHPSKGCRSYIAIQGMFCLPKVMNSFSTYLPGNFGGLNGRTLQVNDTISWKNNVDTTEMMHFPKEEIPYFSSKITVEIERGLEFYVMDDNAQKQFHSTSFSVTSQSNRMGIRLSGGNIDIKNVEMISSPVIPGVIQLPPSGNPIILMNDSQTIGGYPRIGVVKYSELWRLGQVKSGDQIRFKFFE